jgi:hypothetical protein
MTMLLPKFPFQCSTQAKSPEETGIDAAGFQNPGGSRTAVEMFISAFW